MSSPPPPLASRSGFALVAVLFALAVLTALFATTQKRSLAHLGALATERLILRNGQTARDMLDLGIAWKAHPDNLGQTSLSLIYDGSEHILLFQDVGGLIDLNTAAPALLANLAEHFDIAPEALGRYRDWRRDQHRLLRVADFLRLTNQPQWKLEALEKVATVHSGRTGIAPMLAPLEALTAATGTKGTRDLMIGHLPAENVSEPSNSNFAVWLIANNRPLRALGTIHIAPDPTQSRILALR